MKKILSISFSFFLFICIFYGIVSGENISIMRGMSQDTDMLEESNGRIVEAKYLEIGDDLKEKIHEASEKFKVYENQFYEIKYMSNGLKIQGFIVKPDEKKEYPVIIVNRGGFDEIPKRILGRYFSYLASKGYVVMTTHLRGIGKSEGTIDPINITDVLNLIPAAKSLNFTNPDKVAMVGINATVGMMTYNIIKENSEDIKVAYINNGITDALQAHKDGPLKFKNLLERLFGGKPQFEEDIYKEYSAYYWPEKIDVPVLIVHGGKNKILDVKQAEKLSKKLSKLDKTPKLKIYEKGDSVLRNLSLDETTTVMFEWFNKYLE